jgi:RND family efflux transporter MFP subunit
MKNHAYLIFLVIALMVTACSGASTPDAIPTISLDDDSSQPSPSSFAGSVSASGIVVPVKKVELSFPTGGLVKTVEVVAGDPVTANQPLIILDTAILEARVAEAEAAVVTQSTTLKYLQRTIDAGASQERLDAAQANIDAAIAGVDIAKAQLAQATLTAPFAGTVASVNVSPAEFANAGQIVVTVGDLTRFQVETTDLSESDVTAVKQGQPARVYIEALNQEVTGVVLDVARLSSTVGGDVVYTVTIEFDEQPDGLRWGMSAEVQIDAE